MVLYVTIEPAGHDPRPVPGQARAGTDDHTEVRYTVLSHRAIALWAVLILSAGVGMAVWLLLTYSGGGPSLQLDTIRTAGTVVVGAGGAAALLLAARRQRTAEIALKQKDRDQVDVARAHALQERVAAETRAHQERVAQDAREDAAARRITELYTAAAVQLGSDKAPVRLAGLYALERLAQDNPPQRQTIVNVLSAYLRMPYTLPGELPGDSVDVQNLAARRERVQEREVRLTAQRVLAAHLRPGDKATPADTFWADTDLDLTGAVLIDFDLYGCHLRTAQFTSAKFAGDASFSEVTFSHGARFGAAKFTGTAQFGEAEFGGDAQFVEAEFSGDAEFGEAKFAGTAWFSEVKFTDDAWFDETEFASGAHFHKAEFAGTAWFGKARLVRDAEFGARFAGDANFDEAKFAGTAWFGKARFVRDAEFGARFAGDANFDEAEFAGTVNFGDAQFTGDASFDEVVFEQGVPTAVERFWSPPAEEEAVDRSCGEAGQSVRLNPRQTKQ